MALVELRGVDKTYGAAIGDTATRRVLRNLDFELSAGRFIAITGESGIGKSTVLNLIAGLDRPDAGRILFDGQDYAGLDDDALTRLRRRRMGFVFQAFHLLPYLDVERNATLPLLLDARLDDEGRARARRLLGRLGLADRLRSAPLTLSGGEMQRVALARALVHRPALLLADEPTGNLDPQSAGQALRLLREVVEEEGAACVLVTHSRTAAAAADECYVLGEEGLRRER